MRAGSDASAPFGGAEPFEIEIDLSRAQEQPVLGLQARPSFELLRGEEGAREAAGRTTADSLGPGGLGSPRAVSKDYEQAFEESVTPMFGRTGSTGSFPRETDSLLADPAGGGGGAFDDDGSAFVFRSGRGGLLVEKEEVGCCPVCCTIFSLIGVVYLSILGAYAGAGWNYFNGAWEPEKNETVSRNAYISAGFYGATAILSGLVWMKRAYSPGYVAGTRRVVDRFS